MATIDLDTAPPRARQRVTVATLALVAAVALLTLGTSAPAAVTTTVLVDASPPEHATAAVWLADGTQLAVELGQPLRVAGPVAGVQVFVPGDHDAAEASCSIRIDGRTVAEYTAVGVGSAASCVWPG